MDDRSAAVAVIRARRPNSRSRTPSGRQPHDQVLLLRAQPVDGGSRLHPLGSGAPAGHRGVKAWRTNFEGCYKAAVARERIRYPVFDSNYTDQLFYD